MSDNEREYLLDKESSYLNVQEEVTNYSTARGYIWPLALAFCINYILGTGFQSIPYAYQDAGIIPSTIIILIATALAILANNWQLETIARCHPVVLARESDSSRKAFLLDYEDNEDEVAQIEKEEGLLVRNTVYEVPKLFEVFIGLWMSRVYTAVFIVYMFGALWAYTVVMGLTMTTVIPFPGLTHKDDCNAEVGESCPTFSTGCSWAYVIYVAIMGCMITCLSVLDLKEQKALQVTLAFVRGVGLTLIVICIIGAMATAPYSSYDNNSEGTDGSHIATPVNYFDASGLSSIITAAVYSQLLHHSTPGLTQLVRDKRELRVTFVSSFFICCMFYLMLSFFATLYFGDEVNQTLSLQWSTYSNGWAGSNAWWAHFCAYFILMFPALECFSAFPLCAITLGNNIFATLPNEWTDDGTSRLVKIICRLIATIPPLILGTTTHCLNVIVRITGLPGFFIMLIFPAILQIKSTKVANEVLGSARTFYTCHFSHNIYCYAVILVALGCFVLTLVQLFMDAFN